MAPSASVDGSTRVSLPSPSDRTQSSPPAAFPARAPRPAAGAGAVTPRTNATRDPSGDGTMPDSICGVVHIAAALPPSSGTRQRSPLRGIISARPSALQNAPASVAPASGSSRGADAPDDETMNTFDTPA